MGIRGIPANYGGFETFAEELAPRLAERGHDVTVYGRSNNIRYEGREYRGVRLVILPTVSHKYLDTPVHTLLSVAHSVFDRYDVVLVCNGANAIFTPVPRLTGAKIVLNVDGIERLRKKWGLLGRLWYRLGEKLATRFPDAIVSDARVIHEYYLREYGIDSNLIPYGASFHPKETTETLQRFGVQPREYVLYVSRLEPENNAHVVIEGFRRVETDKRLVIVGDAPYAPRYKEHLHELANRDPRVVMTGFVYGEGYRELQSHAFCYVQATEVGGTHPALIESMRHGNAIIANGTPENLEVIGGTGLLYRFNDSEDLAHQLRRLLENPRMVDRLRSLAEKRAERRYSWDAVTVGYEELFCRLSGAPATATRGAEIA